MLSDTPSLADLYEAQQQEMQLLWDGGALRATAASLLNQLPSGRLVLWASSSEGAGLAAACAVLRDEPTAWRQVQLLDPPARGDDQVVVLEPVDGGLAWRQAIMRACPDALILVASNEALSGRASRQLAATAAAAA